MHNPLCFAYFSPRRCPSVLQFCIGLLQIKTLFRFLISYLLFNEKFLQNLSTSQITRIESSLYYKRHFLLLESCHTFNQDQDSIFGSLVLHYLSRRLFKNSNLGHLLVRQRFFRIQVCKLYLMSPHSASSYQILLGAQSTFFLTPQP